MEHVVVSVPEEYTKVMHADGKTPKRIELAPTKHYRAKKGLPADIANR